MSADWMREVCGIEPAPDLDEVAADGLARLGELAEVVAESGDNDAATAAVSSWLQDPATVRAAAEAVRRKPAAVTGLIAGMGRRKGFKGQADRVLEALKQEARGLEKEARRGREHIADEALPGKALDRAVGRDDLPVGLVVPAGWEVDLGGFSGFVSTTRPASRTPRGSPLVRW